MYGWMEIGKRQEEGQTEGMTDKRKVARMKDGWKVGKTTENERRMKGWEKN